MPPPAIELILARQWGSYLATPFFLIDAEGTLLFYNEPAEAVLGWRFEEMGEMPSSELARIFETTDEEGDPLPNEALPLTIALDQRRPAFRRFWICGLDNVARQIEVLAFPLIGAEDQHWGAAALFWEIPGTPPARLARGARNRGEW
jgi:PAS domain-containing protein